eukprot:jgi/Botrbrau1/8266/Bobra.0001s0017.1
MSYFPVVLPCSLSSSHEAVEWWQGRSEGDIKLAIDAAMGLQGSCVATLFCVLTAMDCLPTCFVMPCGLTEEGTDGMYGSPSPAGDITYIDYLFLGDYVDRGAHSLETICLLLALKLQYPTSVHLIRGNHEAADINALFGFRLECMERLGEAGGVYAWTRFNNLFNWLPLAALIEGRILCMHGGIGRSITRVEQISDLQRPLTMEEGGVVLMDLLWSDPTTNDTVEGVQPSPRGPGLVTFGPDRVSDFCKTNDLQMIVRAHECVMDGFERFAQGQLITLFSATNYCGNSQQCGGSVGGGVKTGAILVLGRDLVMVPKLIHRCRPLLPRIRTEEELGEPVDVEEEPPPHPSSTPGLRSLMTSGRQRRHEGNGTQHPSPTFKLL